MDGRDIGTVVLQEAELKFFMTADAEVRAKRRFDELRAKSIEVSYNEVLENVTKRDSIDSTREHSPLKQAADSFVVDNTDLTIDEQFQFILSQVHKKLEQLDSTKKVSSN
jgi:CMP/dCMP kinase